MLRSALCFVFKDFYAVDRRNRSSLRGKAPSSVYTTLRVSVWRVWTLLAKTRQTKGSPTSSAGHDQDQEAASLVVSSLDSPVRWWVFYHREDGRSCKTTLDHLIPDRVCTGGRWTMTNKAGNKSQYLSSPSRVKHFFNIITIILIFMSVGRGRASRGHASHTSSRLPIYFTSIQYLYNL